MKKLIVAACIGLMFAVPPVAVAGAQQEKMKTCNKDAKEKALKGGDRKAFMKDCLSNKADASGDQKTGAEPGGKRHAQREK